MIRKFNKDDIGKVTQIWLEANTKAHNFIPESYWVEHFNDTEKIIPQSEVYVYEKDGEILGFLGLSGHYIAGVFVSNTSQSMGIGKKLLDHVKGIKAKLSLSVYQKNERAIEFYKRENFKIKCQNSDENTGELEFYMIWCRQ